MLLVTLRYGIQLTADPSSPWVGITSVTVEPAQQQTGVTATRAIRPRVAAGGQVDAGGELVVPVNSHR